MTVATAETAASLLEKLKGHGLILLDMSEIYPQYSKDLTEKTARICELVLELEARKERIAKLEAALREILRRSSSCSELASTLQDARNADIAREALKP